MLKLKVVRDTFTETSTIGKMLVNDEVFCDTLEDRVRHGVKVFGQTAIPEGTYDVIIAPSPAHDGRLMPRILNVPGFYGILIHSGNDADDTKGCILVGFGRRVDWILNSRTAYQKLYPIIDEALTHGNRVQIEVTHAS
jgi:hypothetical protein